MARGNKLRDIEKAARDQGIEWEVTNGNHVRFFRPGDQRFEGRSVIAGISPSDFRSERALIVELRKYLGFVWPWNKIAERRQMRKERRNGETN